MWIKLIQPKITPRPGDTALKNQIFPSLGLPVLAALTPERHRLTLVDENVESNRLDDQPDLVGISVKADTAARAYELAEHYRQKGVPVILGGVHPTACPDDALAHADAVVVGEAEEIWGKILEDAEQGRLERIYRQNGPTDLSRVPIPRFDLIRSKPYVFSHALVASRGCQWRCDFCYCSSLNFPRGHRMKPVASILAEIKALGSRHVFFIDDDLVGSPARARELFQALIPLGLTWHAEVSADVGRQEDLLDLMAASGCQSLFIGFETIRADSLSEMHKNQNRVEEYNRTIARIHQRGMMVNASVIFGFDSDGPEVFRETVHWLIAQKVETMSAHVLTPYPGTVYYDRLLEEGRVLDLDLRHYNTAQAVFRPLKMTAEELEAGYHWALREFYSWPSIWERLPLHSPHLMAFLLFNLGYRKWGTLVSAISRLGLTGAFARMGRVLSYPRTLLRSSIR